jgi:preprotein translocase subunit Sec63
MFQTQCYQRLSRVIVYLPSNDAFQDQITLRKCIVNAVDVTKLCEKGQNKETDREQAQSHNPGRNIWFTFEGTTIIAESEDRKDHCVPQLAMCKYI